MRKKSRLPFTKVLSGEYLPICNAGYKEQILSYSSGGTNYLAVGTAKKRSFRSLTSINTKRGDEEGLSEKKEACTVSVFRRIFFELFQARILGLTAKVKRVDGVANAGACNYYCISVRTTLGSALSRD